MRFQRRRLLRILSFAFGSTSLLSRNQLANAAQISIEPMLSSSPAAAVEHGLAAAPEMEKVTGIGGLFFVAKDPKGLAHWYQQHLGISLTPSSYTDSVWQQEAGPTVFDPLPQTSDYFKGTPKVWMINFRVRDLEKMAAQLQAAEITVKVDPQTYPNGRFASLHDPEGNPIELWQPANPNVAH